MNVRVLLPAGLRILLLTLAVIGSQGGSLSYAASDSWKTAASGDYSVGSNWLGGNIPNAAGDHADFSLLDITSDVSVTLNANVTLGRLSFGDTNTATGGSWELRTDTANVITLDNGANKPVLTANPLVPFTTFDDAFVGPSLAGTNGFTKAGTGILTIGGTANTVTGGINVDAGTLRLRAAVPNQAMNLANGVTLDTTVSIRNTAGINVATGTTATIISGGGERDLGNFNAAGATVNLNIPTGTVRANDNWALNGAITTLNITGADAAINKFGLRNNGGTFNAASFAGTTVNLDKVTLWTRSNSGGNTNQIGALSGTSTAILSGGGQGGGSFGTYQIGALNTNTEFAGTIDTTSSPPANSTTDLGGLNINKVGTGTLTLSGTLLYQPTGNTTVNRRGGITTVTAGTLALTNSAAIPGGIVHTTQGNILSTINILSGASLNVTGYSGSYSTANLQQVVGAGTIVGNYTHDEGVIRPANTISGTTASGTNPSVATAGTINFANNLTWSGGDYTYDTSLNPASGNDLISVTGAATLTSGTITPNFLAGIPTSGTYTVMTAGSFSGSPSSIVVNWPGRAADPVPFIDGNSLKFNAPGISSANIVWAGNNGPNWDVEATANWTGASPNTFFQSDNVTFNDSANTFAVNVAVGVQPSSVTVDNSTNEYTISGTNGIGGSATFTKTGSAKLTMTTANTFTGAASVTGSTVDIGSANGALGTGPLTLSNATLLTTNTTSVGLTNSSMTLAAGTSNTISGTGNTTNPFSMPAMSGDGDLTITSTTVGKGMDIGAAAGFTGDLYVVGATDTDGIDPLVTTNTTIVRMNGAGSNMPNSKVTLTNGASLRDRATSAQTLAIGALEGDATATLYGYQGGSGATARTWQIGSLNTNTTFAGVVQDSAGSSSTTAPVTVQKVGTGTLSLSGPNTYTGDTKVDAGTLSISSPYLSDAADVYLLTGATFNLNFGSLATIDTIDSLFINGASQAVGTWGRIGSGAAHESAFFTGDGLLLVSTAVATPGDFNLDGKVDGADFLAWQRGFPGTYTATDLTNWKTNYGVGAAAAANGGATVGAVPEPATILLGVAGFLGLIAAKRK